MPEILVLYYSVGGSVKRMAELVAAGIERVPGAAAPGTRSMPEATSTAMRFTEPPTL